MKSDHTKHFLRQKAELRILCKKDQYLCGWSMNACCFRSELLRSPPALCQRRHLHEHRTRWVPLRLSTRLLWKELWDRWATQQPTWLISQCCIFLIKVIIPLTFHHVIMPPLFRFSRPRLCFGSLRQQWYMPWGSWRVWVPVSTRLGGSDLCQQWVETIILCRTPPYSYIFNSDLSPLSPSLLNIAFNKQWDFVCPQMWMIVPPVHVLRVGPART